MFACFTQIKRIFVILSFLFLCCLFNPSCKPKTSSINNSNKFYKYNTTEAKFDLGNTDEFDITNLSYTSDGNGRLLMQYRKKNRSDEIDLGWFLRLSKDDGKTFGKEYEVFDLIRSDEKFDSYNIILVPNGFAVITSHNKNLYYAQSKENLENWSKLTQINDEQNSVSGEKKLLQISENDVYIIWVDNRLGVNLIFFSSSTDGGKIWSANQPIDYDFRESSQEACVLIKGANGRILVFWQDWRDRKTLADIRYSYSDDNGVNWRESQKINDDDKEVWQMAPSVVSDGTNIYVVFADFREKGEENDNDWNIYFSRSTDNGTTWGKNKRLNDVKEGRDEIPFLSIDNEGNLFCFWVTGRETIFWQVVFSYSNDKGDSWSPSIPITSKDEMVIGKYTTIQYFSLNKFLIRIEKEEYGNKKTSYHYLEKTNELIDSKIEPKKNNDNKNLNLIKFEIGKNHFADDFSGKSAENWEVESGVWDIVGGTYMGVYPNGRNTYVSYAKFQEPEKYILKGRFRFDSVAHTAASLYFRIGKKGLRHYVITNRFRYGAWLSLKDNELPNGLHFSGGEVITQKRFPFKKDLWYRFTLVVTPKQVDYYVEERLMLSYKGELILPKGRIGIGGFQSSPTYFDDISVWELKE